MSRLGQKRALGFRQFVGIIASRKEVPTVPPELWNRLGTKILPKLRSGSELKIGLEFSVTVPADLANGLATELRQILQELGIADAVRAE